MYITSTINPLTKSNNDIPVVLLCYKEMRKFILRPKDYTELVWVTQENFDLGLDTIPVFETSTLDICRGRNVEIDESAYALMSGFLDEITVMAKERVKEPERESPEPKPVLEEVTPAPQTPSVTPPSLRRDIELRLAEVKQAKDAANLDARGRQAIASGSGERQNSMSPNEDEAEEVQGRRTETETEVTVIQTSVARTEEGNRSKITTSSSTQIRQTSEINHALHVEEEEEGRDPRGVNNPWGELGDSWKGLEELQSDLPVEEPKVSQKDIENLLHKSLVNTKQEIPFVSGRSVDTTKNGERFNVTICGPLPDQEAAFKTRGQHAVRKVLAGACNNFGIPFEEASLMIVTTTYDEDGEAVQRMTKCSNNLTIAECGIDEHTHLIIALDHEQEQESDPEDRNE